MEMKIRAQGTAWQGTPVLHSSQLPPGDDLPWAGGGESLSRVSEEREADRAPLGASWVQRDQTCLWAQR